jgi:hypothetical protein
MIESLFHALAHGVFPLEMHLQVFHEFVVGQHIGLDGLVCVFDHFLETFAFLGGRLESLLCGFDFLILPSAVPYQIIKVRGQNKQIIHLLSRGSLFR